MGTMNTKEIIEGAEAALIHTYNRYQIVLEKGDGVRLYDKDGREYLDFGAGIAVYAAAILSRTPITVSRAANGFGGLSLIPWILELTGLGRFIAAGEYVKEMDHDEIDRSIRSGSALRILLAAASMIAGLIDMLVHRRAAAGDALVVLAVAVSIGATWLVRHVYAQLLVTTYSNQNGSPGRRI